MAERKTILITGCAGLIGSRFAEWVLSNTDCAVVGIDDLSGGYPENIPAGVKFYKLDLTNAAALNAVFQQHKFDLVYHFAAYAAECLSPFIRRFNYTNNLVATAGLVNMCITYESGRLVFTSSVAVYGNGTPPFDETLPRRPIDPYGNAKAACEVDIEIAAEQHGLDYCIVRPHNVYGYNQNIWDSYRNFVGIAIYKSMIGDPITIFGDGLQQRAFSEMTDSLQSFWRAGTEPAASRQIINLGGVTESTVLDVANIVRELAGAELIFLPPRHEVRNAFCTHRKSVELLGFEHRTELYDGVKNMWEWAKLQPRRERFVWGEYEVEKGVYEYWRGEALRDGYFRKS